MRGLLTATGCLRLTPASLQQGVVRFKTRIMAMLGRGSDVKPWVDYFTIRKIDFVLRKISWRKLLKISHCGKQHTTSQNTTRK
jgi:hypothetical protein